MADCRTVGKEYDGAQYEFIRIDTAQQTGICGGY